MSTDAHLSLLKLSSSNPGSVLTFGGWKEPEKEFKVGDLAYKRSSTTLLNVWEITHVCFDVVLARSPDIGTLAFKNSELRHMTEEEKMKYDVYGAVENIDKLAAVLRLSQSTEGKWAWVDGDIDTTEYLDSRNMTEVVPDEIDIQEITRQIARQYS